jgi:pyrroline-5-carboxylate reductase
MSETLLLIGCGKMGTALLAGWIAQGLAPINAYVVEADTAQHERIRAMGVNVVAGPAALPHGLAPATIVLAVKPQSMDTVVPAYAGPAATALTISIAAGKSLAYYEKLLGESRAIVRVMPNTPAAVGRGMSVCVANARTSEAQREKTGELMSAVGDVAWIEDESLMDAVTAVSGSGPAYAFLLVECMAQAGIAVGLAPDLAMRLARQTVIGSGELMAQASEDATTLRKNVTSPGGTTEAALKILMGEPGMTDLMTKAIEAATRRGRELAS